MKLIVAISAGFFLMAFIGLHSSRGLLKGKVAWVLPWFVLSLGTSTWYARTVQTVLAASLLFVLAAIARQRIRLAAPLRFLSGYATVGLLLSPWSIDTRLSLLKAGAYLSLVLVVGAIFGDQSRVAFPLARSLMLSFPISLIAVAIMLIVMSPDQALAGSGVERLTIPHLHLHPNTFALLLVVALLGAALAGKHRVISREQVMLTFGAATPLLLLTRSRTALMLLALGVMTVAFVRRASVRVMFAMGAALLVLIVLYAGPTESYLVRSQQGSQIAELSGRLPIWSAAVDVWRTSPVVGRGYYAGPSTLIEQSAPHLYFSYDISTSDNVFLDALVGTGLVGAAGLLLAAGAAVSLVWRARAALPGRSSHEKLGMELCAVTIVLILGRSLSAGGLDVVSVPALLFTAACQLMVRLAWTAQSQQVVHQS